MKRLIVVLCVIASMLFTTATINAATVTGVVKDGTGKVLPGVKVVYRFVDGNLTMYTNALGKYTGEHHNWCDSPQAVFTKTGYFMVSVQVPDGTCWGCNPECPPAYAQMGCASTIGRSVTMIRNPLVKIKQEGMLLPMVGLYMATFCQYNVCDYDCLYQWVADVTNGPEHMFGQPTDDDISLPPCPDVITFVDFVNNWLDAMHDYYYGDNFPDE